MYLHEYQGKGLLQEAGIPVPPFEVATHYKEVEGIIRRLHLQEGVIKAQIHAGGRGKVGGIRVGRSFEELLYLAKELLGMKIINEQTGPEGLMAHKVLITPVLDFKEEYYLGVAIDRERERAVLIASLEGGVNIEEVAFQFPHRVLKIPIELNGSVRPYQLLRLAKFMKWQNHPCGDEGIKIAKALAKLFVDKDASLIEINPLAQDRDGKIWAVDAKVVIDDNALYRQSEIAAMYDPSQQSRNEIEAREQGLSYVALRGNIGCMVNGAGLAMATADLIQLMGGKAANFLDIGGSATVERIAEGIKILLSDPQIKAVLINIFGGIVNCTVVAEGVLTALSMIPTEIPFVVRMEGTGIEEGKRIFDKSKFKIQTANLLDEAVKLVIQEVHGHSR